MFAIGAAVAVKKRKGKCTFQTGFALIEDDSNNISLYADDTLLSNLNFARKQNSPKYNNTVNNFNLFITAFPLKVNRTSVSFYIFCDDEAPQVLFLLFFYFKIVCIVSHKLYCTLNTGCLLWSWTKQERLLFSNDIFFIIKTWFGSCVHEISLARYQKCCISFRLVLKHA